MVTLQPRLQNFTLNTKCPGNMFDSYAHKIVFRGTFCIFHFDIFFSDSHKTSKGYSFGGNDSHLGDNIDMHG